MDIESSTIVTKEQLDNLYHEYCSSREGMHPDPVSFLFRYDDLRDREIVGLIASSLAYGRVAHILKSVEQVLSQMSQPRQFILGNSHKDFQKIFKNFKHRFTTSDDVAHLCVGIKNVIGEFGSLYDCFMSGYNDNHETVLPALTGFLCNLQIPGDRCNSLIPAPEKKSAMKRMNLFLRWMVRKDAIDPGGWEKVSKSKLILPLDVHTHRMGIKLGLTERKPADIRTALEITKALREFDPEDPVKYDFALTKYSIDLNRKE
ncbi:MAG: TIGR02757 family protein [Acidobacteria bacterium]|nr:TIGR02757 family protein [Acidobacteriota bacterium]